MEIVFLPDAVDDLNYWKKSGNKAVLKKISQLTSAILETPYTGIGKPEPLKYDLSGKWSRRINHVDRYVYRVEPDKLIVYSVRGHYL
ncbi:Txe/YoeB family addiction module toxin [Parapedobacter sp. 10938]|uniref:Txe/YoeB family addiction module toxin n=1 Tax=Parapedobacter flavus TaxID=3110225 RepID=UPI002DB94DC5|nr:Txe/YoeB family addiction module toxin [Parapedobacter sp. 10938]MEC3880343.1 Txe/YoeB family addiction module toxin [Parapedobacter sp. 10938]